MDLFQLRYFQVVAMENHLTRASQKLNIAQPALSSSIARLEKEMGVQLFDRVGRQIMLNDYGRLLLEHVDIILNNWDVAYNKITQRQREENRHIKFAATGMVFPQRLILDFKTAYPDISIKQSMIQTDQIVSSLVTQRVDFVISTIPVEESNIASYFVKEESISIAVSKSHPFASRKSITIKELKGQPFISIPEGYAFRDFTNSLCRKAGFEQNVVFECYPSQFSDLVSYNVGIVFATETSVAEGSFHPSISIIPIVSPPCRRTISILWEKSRIFSDVTKLFYDFCTQYELPREHCDSSAIES